MCARVCMYVCMYVYIYICIYLSISCIPISYMSLISHQCWDCTLGVVKRRCPQSGLGGERVYKEQQLAKWRVDRSNCPLRVLSFSRVRRREHTLAQRSNLHHELLVQLLRRSWVHLYSSAPQSERILAPWGRIRSTNCFVEPSVYFLLCTPVWKNPPPGGATPMKKVRLPLDCACWARGRYIPCNILSIM